LAKDKVYSTKSPLHAQAASDHSQLNAYKWQDWTSNFPNKQKMQNAHEILWVNFI